MSTNEIPELIVDWVDAVYEHITDEPQTPSALARKAKIATVHAGVALRWMASNDFVIAVGNGSWTKYRARRFGEYNAKPAHRYGVKS